MNRSPNHYPVFEDLRPCRRSACGAPASPDCIHSGTGDAYCPRCARRINEFNPNLVRKPMNDITEEWARTAPAGTELDRVCAELKWIPGYESRYAITKDGRLFSKIDQWQQAASTPEPPPELSERSEPVFPFIIEQLRNAKYNTETANWLADLLEERRNFGLQKYGQELHTHNGRDAIEDARQELGDLVVYLTQASMEGRSKEVGDLLSKMRTIAACLRE